MTGFDEDERTQLIMQAGVSYRFEQFETNTVANDNGFAVAA